MGFGASVPGGGSGNGIAEAALEIVGEAQEGIESELNSIGSDASAQEILGATVKINDLTNQSAAAIAATSKEDQAEQQAVAMLK